MGPPARSVGFSNAGLFRHVDTLVVFAPRGPGRLSAKGAARFWVCYTQLPYLQR